MVTIKRRRAWSPRKTQFVSTGVSFGSALAIVLSYVQNNSVFWAIVHGIFSWLYVIYFIIRHRIFA